MALAIRFSEGIFGFIKTINERKLTASKLYHKQILQFLYILLSAFSTANTSEKIGLSPERLTPIKSATARQIFSPFGLQKKHSRASICGSL
jgi:hypothetical protein